MIMQTYNIKVFQIFYINNYQLIIILNKKKALKKFAQQFYYYKFKSKMIGLKFAII